MTRAQAYRVASSASTIAAAAAMMLRGTLPSGPTDFAGGFFVALAAGFWFSARLSDDTAEE